MAGNGAPGDAMSGERDVVVASRPVHSPPRANEPNLLPDAEVGECLKVSDLTCVYGLEGAAPLHALGPIDLSLSTGEFVSIVGPSGCGKSTLVKVVAGLTPPANGEVTIHLSGRTRTPLATVFQDFGIFPWKTVLANVEFGLRVGGVSRKESRDRARDWLERVGLGPFVKSYPAQLSGGMRQRVAIARALVVQPEILLMDEPFASLDAQLREIMQDELIQITQRDQRTIIFVTHSLEEAMVLADRVVVMSARPGRIIVDVQMPFGRPRDVRVRESAEFGRMRLELWEQLREQVNKQLDGALRRERS